MKQVLPSPTRSPARRRLFSVLLALILATVGLGGSEIVWRLMGHRPWNPTIRDLRVEPGGHMFERDSVLGYRLLEGAYRITLETGYSYNATHLPDRYRITSSLDPSTADPRTVDEIWIFGCSFVYGYSVDNEQSMCWELQRRFPSFRIRNFGVPGYGTVHSLLQFRQALAAGPPPKAAIVCYFGDHDRRNTFTRSRRQLLFTYSRLGPMGQPYAELDADDQLALKFDEVVYREFPGVRWSAVVNSLEQMFSAALEKRARSHDVTKALFMEISDEARKHHVPLIVAGMSPFPDTADILKFCAQRNIAVANISCDWQLPAAFNAPADPFHPSPLGYRAMADRLDAYLKLQFWLDDFRREVADQSASTEAHEAVGRAAQAAGKLDEAAGELQAAIALAPQQPLLHSYLGGLRLQAGRPTEAIAEFARELEIQPDHFESTAQMAAALQSLGDNDRAIERYREALKLCAFWATGHNNLGALLSAKGELDEAAAEFTEALRYQPDLFEASAQLALCLARLRHDASAVKQFQAALGLRPDWREGRRQLAWILATSYAPDVHNVTQSLELAQQLCQETQFNDPASLEALAAALAASGDFETALRWQTKAVDGMPADSPARAAARDRFERYQQQKPWRE